MVVVRMAHLLYMGCPHVVYAGRSNGWPLVRCWPGRNALHVYIALIVRNSTVALTSKVITCSKSPCHGQMARGASSWIGWLQKVFKPVQSRGWVIHLCSKKCTNVGDPWRNVRAALWREPCENLIELKSLPWLCTCISVCQHVYRWRPVSTRGLGVFVITRAP